MFRASTKCNERKHQWGRFGPSHLSGENAALAFLLFFFFRNSAWYGTFSESLEKYSSLSFIYEESP